MALCAYLHGNLHLQRGLIAVRIVNIQWASLFPSGQLVFQWNYSPETRFSFFNIVQLIYNRKILSDNSYFSELLVLLNKKKERERGAEKIYFNPSSLASWWNQFAKKYCITIFLLTFSSNFFYLLLLFAFFI